MHAYCSLCVDTVQVCCLPETLNWVAKPNFLPFECLVVIRMSGLIAVNYELFVTCFCPHSTDMVATRRYQDMVRQPPTSKIITEI